MHYPYIKAPSHDYKLWHTRIKTVIHSLSLVIEAKFNFQDAQFRDSSSETSSDTSKCTAFLLQSEDIALLLMAISSGCSQHSAA